MDKKIDLLLQVDFLSMGYKKDVFASFAYEFEPLQK